MKFDYIFIINLYFLTFTMITNELITNNRMRSLYETIVLKILVSLQTCRSLLLPASLMFRHPVSFTESYSVKSS